MLRHWAAVQPDAPMLTLGGTTVTWGECYDRAVTVAAALSAEGIVPGKRVAFLDRNGIEFFEVFFGCALLGAVSVAVNWRLAPAEMAAIIEDAGSPVLVYGPDYEAAVKEIAPALDCVRSFVPLTAFDDWRDAHSGSATDPGFVPGPEDVITQLYTSGTTGLPKGVMISGRNLATILGGAPEVFRIDETTVSMVAMPLFHIGGTGWALSGMSRGGHSILVRDIDALDHRCVRGTRRPDVPAGHAAAGRHRRELAAHHLLRGRPHQRGRAGQVDRRHRVPVRPGLRVDGDDRCHHVPPA
jgi:long-chain acyl-CoA synthetase